MKYKVYGHQKKGNGYSNEMVIGFNIPYASGVLVSSTSDMLKWQNILNQNISLKPENALMAFIKYSLNNGEVISYGYGWHIRDINGTLTKEHGGSIYGFKTMDVYMPSGTIYVFGLTNCDCDSTSKIIQDIAKL